MPTVLRSNTARGAALGLAVAAAAWLASLPAAGCPNTGDPACYVISVLSGMAMVWIAVVVGVCGAFLLHLPRFWLVALFGLATTLLVAFCVAVTDCPGWLAAAGALAGFPLGAALAGRGTVG